MNVLPVVGRELRVAARRRSTYWVRVGGAGIGLLIGAGFLLVSGLAGTRASEIGSALFNVLTWLGLAAGLSAGLFFTSDCLSQEKREGTLGLLFLTRLRGYDVALGKLFATSLRGFYAVLAVLPLLAITQIMGGVSPARYWQSSLALVNGLILSLSAGLFISAISRDSQKALGATFFLMVLITLGGPLADAIIVAWNGSGFQPRWSRSSPGFALFAAGGWRRQPYWTTLLLTQLMGWVMLGLACLLVPRTWQEKAGVANARRGWAYDWKYGRKERRERLKRRLLGLSPMTWLVCRERWQALGMWALAVLAMGGLAAILLAGLPVEAYMLWNAFGGLFTVFLYVWAASQAGRFFLEARKSGLLELLLASPLNERRITLGHWRALLRMFALPAMLLVGVYATGVALSQMSYQRVVTRATTVAPAAGSTNQGGTIVTNQTVVVTGPTISVSVGGGNGMASSRGLIALQRARAALMAVLAALTTVANLAALCWFGMWMGMTSPSANLATLKTLLFVQIIPWFVIAFGTTTAMGVLMMRNALLTGAAGTTRLLWFPLVSAALMAALAIGKDVGFILWSRKRLYSSLRGQASQGSREGASSARPMSGH